jgi:hypothetical protein
MARRKYNWMWRRLAEQGTSARRTRVPWRIEYQGDPTLRQPRQHISHSITPAVERFNAMTKEVAIGDDRCLVWCGGETFRIDEATITTPARFYWEVVKGERLKDAETLRRTCKTPHCVKHKVKR